MLQRLILLIGLVLMPFSSVAQENATVRIFTIGVKDFDNAPHYFIKDGQYAGFGRAVLDLFASKHGYQFIYQPAPSLRVVHALLAGDVDFQYPDASDWMVKEKTGHQVYYSLGVVGYIDGVSRRKQDIGQKLESLRRIAMPRGWTANDYAPLVEQHRLTIEQANTVESVVAMLLAGRVDGIYLNVDAVNTYLRDHGLGGQILFDKTLPYRFSQFHLSSTDHPDIIAEFDRFLTEDATEIAGLRAAYGLIYDHAPTP